MIRSADFLGVFIRTYFAASDQRKKTSETGLSEVSG